MKIQGNLVSHHSCVFLKATDVKAVKSVYLFLLLELNADAMSFGIIIAISITIRVQLNEVRNIQVSLKPWL